MASRTVIDELVIEFGLDPSKFTKGQKQVIQGIKDTEDQAARSAREMDSRGKQAAQYFSRIRNEVLALGAALLGASALKSMTKDLTTSSAAAGRMAVNLGMSTKELTAWQNVAEQAGGTAQSITSALQGLTNEANTAYLTGTSKMIEPLMQLAQVIGKPIPLLDDQGKVRNLTDMMVELSGAFQKLKDSGRASRAQTLGSQLGFDSETINLLMRGPAEIQKRLADAQKDGVTQNQADAAQHLLEEWQKLDQALKSVGNTILEKVDGPLSKVVDELRSFLEENKEEIGEGFKHFVEDMEKVDWKTVVSEIRDFIHGANEAADAVGGWVRISEVLLGLWVGAKLAGAIAGVGRLAGVVEGVLTTIVAINPALAAAIGAAIATKEVLTPGTLNAGEDEFIRAHPEIFPKPPSHEELLEMQGDTPGRQQDKVRGKSGYKQSDLARDTDVEAFVKMGWTREQAIGIATNVMAESHGDPNLPGDNGAAYGLAQWHKDRQDLFKKVFGKDIKSSSREEQLKFIDYELRNGGTLERKAGDALKKSTSATDAASIVSRMYERPGAQIAEAVKRSNLAAGYIAAHAAGSTGQSAPPSTHSTAVSVGQITINTQATDASGIVTDLRRELQERSWISEGNAGLS